jgi:hypothetical protein
MCRKHSSDSRWLTNLAFHVMTGLDGCHLMGPSLSIPDVECIIWPSPIHQLDRQRPPKGNGMSRRESDRRFRRFFGEVPNFRASILASRGSAIGLVGI